MITVVHIRKVKDHIYCGRGSALGNPFYMRNESQRDKVCEDYEVWFKEHVDKESWLTTSNPSPQEIMLREIMQIAWEGNVNLGCFCAPKRCHCDTIKKFIENEIEEISN